MQNDDRNMTEHGNKTHKSKKCPTLTKTHKETRDTKWLKSHHVELGGRPLTDLSVIICQCVFSAAQKHEPACCVPTRTLSPSRISFISFTARWLVLWILLGWNISFCAFDVSLQILSCIFSSDRCFCQRPHEHAKAFQYKTSVMILEKQLLLHINVETISKQCSSLGYIIHK